MTEQMHSHTVPETYLRNFFEKEQVWQYDLQGRKTYMQNIGNMTNNRIYEFKKDGKIENFKFNEKEFGKIETEYPKYFKRLKMSAEKFQSISKEDKVFWYIWMALQLYRTTKAITLSDELAMKFFSVEKEEAHNITNAITIPFVDMYQCVREEKTYKTAFSKTVKTFEKMNFTVVIIEDEKEFITSDNPVCVIGWEQVVFPVSIKMAIILTKIDENGIYSCTQDIYDYVMGVTIECADKYLRSNNRMSRAEIKSYRNLVR